MKEKVELRTLMLFLQNKKQRQKKESIKTPCKWKDKIVESTREEVNRKDMFVHFFLQPLINEHEHKNKNEHQNKKEWCQRSHFLKIQNKISASVAAQKEKKQKKKNYKNVYDHFENNINDHLNKKIKQVISAAFSDTTLEPPQKKDKHNYISMSITNIQKGFYGNLELRTMASLEKATRYFKDSLRENREMECNIFISSTADDLNEKNNLKDITKEMKK